MCGPANREQPETAEPCSTCSSRLFKLQALDIGIQRPRIGEAKPGCIASYMLQDVKAVASIVSPQARLSLDAGSTPSLLVAEKGL